MQLLFGATSLDILTEVNAVGGGANQSEISSGFTVCLVLVVLIATQGFGARTVGLRWGLVAMALVTTFWTMWCTIDFGSFGGTHPRRQQGPRPCGQPRSWAIWL